MKKTEELLQTLNSEQRAAVVHRGGDSLILAGAGSGKTRVLTSKIAYLLASDPQLHPSQILALTFTRKAAEEMRSRISNLVGRDRARMLQMGTFHSVFARWLRGYADRLGFTSDYVIYDTSDSKNVVKTIVREMNLDEKVYKPDAVFGIISGRKNDGTSPQEMAASKDWSLWLKKKKQEMIPAIYAEYVARCRRNDAMDFDDLLLNMYRLLATEKDLLAALRGHFRFILVDEYQDTNFIQDAIIQKLKDPGTEITVVGDDAQSIYSFRGAVIDNIIRFQNHFPGAKVFKLTKNYRSTARIVDLANGVIQKNRTRIPKDVVSVGDKGEKSLLFKAFSGREEAEMVASQIATLHRKGVPYSEIAILYRTNRQSRLFEDELRRARIPNRLYGGISFYDRKEVKMVMAYVRLIINPKDDEAFVRVYNFPARGIGDVTFEKLSAVARSEGLSLYEATQAPQSLLPVMNRGTIAKITAFADLIEGLKAEKETLPPDEFLKLVVQRSGIADLYGDDSSDSQERMDNIQELLSAVAEYVLSHDEEADEIPSIERFVQDMALVTDQDTVSEEDTESVALMTMHGSKGLEFGYVFLPGLEDKIIPSDRAVNEGNEEEERRLFYVALTRAKKRCILSFALVRALNGMTMDTHPSKFLLELDPDLIEDTTGLFSGHFRSAPDLPFLSEPKWRGNGVRTEKGSGVRSGWKKVQTEKISSDRPKSEGSSGGDFEVGDRVRHATFGDGTVLGFEDSVSGLKIQIEFDEMGTKNLIQKYAKLTPIE